MLPRDRFDRCCFFATMRLCIGTWIRIMHTQNVRYLTFHGLARDLMGPDGTLDQVEEELVEHLSNDGHGPLFLCYNAALHRHLDTHHALGSMHSFPPLISIS